MISSWASTAPGSWVAGGEGVDRRPCGRREGEATALRLAADGDARRAAFAGRDDRRTVIGHGRRAGGGIEAAEVAVERQLVRRHPLRKTHRPLARVVLFRPHSAIASRERWLASIAERARASRTATVKRCPCRERGSRTVANASTSDWRQVSDPCAAVASNGKACVDGIVRFFGRISLLTRKPARRSARSCSLVLIGENA